MIIKSTKKLALLDGDYYGFWSDDNVCIPFIDGDYHFTVDATARNKEHPYDDMKVLVSIQNGFAFCEEI
jgi:regulation of enolase protein 1 (concanavalin A-like superfamily)